MSHTSPYVERWFYYLDIHGFLYSSFKPLSSLPNKVYCCTAVFFTVQTVAAIIKLCNFLVINLVLGLHLSLFKDCEHGAEF